MKNNEREKYEEFIEMYDKYEKKAHLIVQTLNPHLKDWQIDIVFEDDIFRGEIELYGSCGYSETEQIYIKQEDLFKDLDIIKEESDKAKIESDEKVKLEKIRKEEKIKKEKLEKEKDTYLLLKNKFES